MNLFDKSIKELRTVCNRLDKFALGQEYSKELWEVFYKMEEEQYKRKNAEFEQWERDNAKVESKSFLEEQGLSKREADSIYSEMNEEA